MVMFDNRSKGLIRGLVYPVQFERNPVDAVRQRLTEAPQAQE